MSHKNAMYLALFSAISGTAMAAPPTEMDAAPVTAAPQAARLGAATLQSASLRGGILPTRVVQLAAPTSTEMSHVRERRIAQVKHGQPLQIGFSRAVTQPLVNLSKLDWQMAADGSRVASLKVSSAQAASLRASLVLRGVGATPGDPSKVTLRFAGNDGRVFAQSGASFTTSGNDIGWSPTVSGEDLLIELSLPAGLYPENFSLSIPQLSHLDISPTASRRDMMTIATGKSGSCENDIVCRANPTSGFTSAANAVARMLFTTSEGTFVCTGTLLNNSNSPKRHLFWTAAHCISTQTVAETLQTYWFYEAAKCNGKTASLQATTLTGGAFSAACQHQARYRIAGAESRTTTRRVLCSMEQRGDRLHQHLDCRHPSPTRRRQEVFIGNGHCPEQLLRGQEAALSRGLERRHHRRRLIRLRPVHRRQRWRLPAARRPPRRLCGMQRADGSGSLLALLGRVFHHFHLLRPVSGQAAWQAIIRLPRSIALRSAIAVPSEALWVQPSVLVLIAGMQRARIRRF